VLSFSFSFSSSSSSSSSFDEDSSSSLSSKVSIKCLILSLYFSKAILSSSLAFSSLYSLFINSDQALLLGL
ncbi:hypothetical protein AWRI1631_161210, partial [Saccharomyces cerevisiae AWRI1631]